jgi:hypothetical protein
MKTLVILISSITALMGTSVRADTVQQMLSELAAGGAGPFTAAAGRDLWVREYPTQGDAKRSCTTCHTADLRSQGRHAVTGKPIGAMAPSVDPQRLSDRREIEKWLRRNCKWTRGRECSAQESGDLLMYLRAQ